MTGKNTAAFGIYTSRSAVEEGIKALRDANFRVEDISVLFPENVGNKDFAHVKGSKAPEGASTGAATGAVMGGVLGWLAGIGAIAIPGVGPFIAAGPIWRRLPASVSGELWAALPEVWRAQAFPNMRPKDMKAGLKKAVF